MKRKKLLKLKSILENVKEKRRNDNPKLKSGHLAVKNKLRSHNLTLTQGDVPKK